MSNIPTAEEIYNKFHFTYKGDGNSVLEAMKEFAKLHVQAALKAADNEAQVTVVDYDGGGFNSPPEPIYGVDSDSILNAYPLTNIK